MTEAEITKLVVKAIDEVAPGKVSGDLNLTQRLRDAGIDSVASMEMVGVIEEELEVTFADEELARINTFGDVIKLVQSNT